MDFLAFHFVFGFCFCKFVNLTEACVSFCRKNQLCDMFENWIDQTPEWHGSCPSPGDSGQERSNGMRTDRIHSNTTLHGKNHVFLCLLPGKG